MNAVAGTVRGCWRAGLSVAAAGALGACSNPTAATSPPGVSCTSYAIHASGQFHDEVWVRVNVTNSSTQAARYAVDVHLNVRSTQPGTEPATQVTISGLIAAKTTAELGRKVLTTDVVRQCRITRLSRS